MADKQILLNNEDEDEDFLHNKRAEESTHEPTAPSYPSPNNTGAPDIPLAEAQVKINCAVCKTVLNIQHLQQEAVVECFKCHECTPISTPPHGKKYVRCPCKCLIMCDVDAEYVVCPRITCKKTIRLPAGGNKRVQCFYCGQLFGSGKCNFMRCPACYKVSCVVPGYIKKRVSILLGLGIMLLLAGIGVTIGTYEIASKSGGIYIAWIGAFISGLSLICRAGYVASFKTSEIYSPNTGV